MACHKFLAMWDMLGLECLYDHTSMEQDNIIDLLKGEISPNNKNINLTYMIMRAQANPQRHYEIYAFESELTVDELKSMFETDPQVIVDAIRDAGMKIYSNRASLKERVIL